MSNDAAGQVLWQVRDLLRNSALRIHDTGLLALQLLVWANLSLKDKVESELQLDTALQRGAAGITDVLGRLALEEGPIGMAFSDAQRRAQFSGDYVASAAVAAKRLVDGGIFERFSPSEIAADLLQSAVDSLPVPAELAALMARIATGNGQATVYCPWESNGQIIASLAQDGLSLYVETPVLSPLPALLSLFRDPPVSFALSDPLRSPTAVRGGKLATFDAALSFPPMGVQSNDDVASQDIYGRFPIKKATTTGLMVQHILAQTHGTVAVVVPNSFLFGPGKDRDVRELILNKGWLRAVVALPQGLYAMTNAPTALLFLDTQNRHSEVRFVDASRPFFRLAQSKGRVILTNTDKIFDYCNAASGKDAQVAEALDPSLAIVTTVDAILANEASLQVDRYVMENEQRKLLAKMRAMQTVALGDIADLCNPIPNKDRNSDAPSAIEVYEVGAVDLPGTGYIGTPEKTISVQISGRRSGAAEDVFLRSGDVVLIIKGSVGKVGIVPEDVPPPGPGGWIAGQSAIVLRGNQPAGDLRALGLWIRSEMGKKVLGGIVSGATIPMISVQSLRNLQVPVFTNDAAQRAAQILLREVDIQLRIEILRAEQGILSERLWFELFE